MLTKFQKSILKELGRKLKSTEKPSKKEVKTDKTKKHDKDVKRAYNLGRGE